MRKAEPASRWEDDGLSDCVSESILLCGNRNKLLYCFIYTDGVEQSCVEENHGERGK